MATYRENNFTRELSELFTKYHKSIESDKHGIFIVDRSETSFCLLMPTEATEDSRNKLIIIDKI